MTTRRSGSPAHTSVLPRAVQAVCNSVDSVIPRAQTVMLIRIEVLVHAALGVVLIGWDSGFHYFLLMFIPALFASMHLRSAWILAICLWAYYVGLYVLMTWALLPTFHIPVPLTALLASTTLT